MIHEAERLTSTVESINTSILTKRRDEALARIKELHSQVVKEVESAQNDEGLRRTCWAPLEALRESVQKQESVAHIAQAVQESERVLDAALGKIDEFLKKKQKKAGGNEPKPVVKPRYEVKPSALLKTTYLETQDDIDGFLDALRRELEDALARGERIQIR